MYYVVLDAARDSQDPTKILGIFKDDEPLANHVRDDHEQRYKDAGHSNDWWSREFLVLEVPELDTIYSLDYASGYDPWGRAYE